MQANLNQLNVAISSAQASSLVSADVHDAGYGCGKRPRCGHEWEQVTTDKGDYAVECLAACVDVIAQVCTVQAYDQMQPGSGLQSMTQVRHVKLKDGADSSE